MGLFDIFSKKDKKPSYDVTNLTIRDINKGFIFEYDMKSWIVKEAYEYDWGNHKFSREFKIDSGDDVAFLAVEEDGELEVSISRPIKIRQIEENVFKEITEYEKAPDIIHYNEKSYYLHSDSAGYFKDLSDEESESEELISYEYYDKEEEEFVSLTQWDERTIEAYGGISIEPYQISNIIPGN